MNVQFRGNQGQTTSWRDGIWPFQIVNGQHPRLSKLTLEKDRKNSELKFEKILAGEPKVVIRPKFLKMTEKLVAVVQSYDTKDLIVFVRKCAYISGIPENQR